MFVGVPGVVTILDPVVAILDPSPMIESLNKLCLSLCVAVLAICCVIIIYDMSDVTAGMSQVCIVSHGHTH